MRRKNEFRGRRIDSGEWAYGYYLYSAIQDEHVIWSDHEYWLVDPETVGQYIGRLDEKGEEIYEDDILRIEIYDRFRPENILASRNEVVEYYDCSFGVKWGFNREFTRFGGFINTTFEVIGNRFENPELMEGKR